MTEAEFHQCVTAGRRRKFTELYNVQHLHSNTIDPVCRVSISTPHEYPVLLHGQLEYLVVDDYTRTLALSTIRRKLRDVPVKGADGGLLVSMKPRTAAILVRGVRSLYQEAKATLRTVV